MSTFTILDDDSFEITISNETIIAELSGKQSLEIDIVLNRESSIQIVQEALSAKTLIAEKIANETISALSVVYLDTFATCKLALNSDPLKSIVMGIALNGGSIGQTIKIQIFGILEDPSLNFGLNELIFLGPSGNIITTQPPSGYLARLGWGLGLGAIQVSIEKPITI